MSPLRHSTRSSPHSIFAIRSEREEANLILTDCQVARLSLSQNTAPGKISIGASTRLTTRSRINGVFPPASAISTQFSTLPRRPEVFTSTITTPFSPGGTISGATHAAVQLQLELSTTRDRADALAFLKSN